MLSTQHLLGKTINCHNLSQSSRTSNADSILDKPQLLFLSKPNCSGSLPSTHRRRRHNSTVELSCVGDCTHPSAVVTQFTISCDVELLRLETTDDIMTSLLNKLPNTDIHQNSRSQTAMFSFQIVDRIRQQSSTRQLDSCVASASAVCIGHYRESCHTALI